MEVVLSHTHSILCALAYFNLKLDTSQILNSDVYFSKNELTEVPWLTNQNDNHLNFVYFNQKEALTTKICSPPFCVATLIYGM